MQPNEPWTVKRILDWTAGYFDRRRLEAPRLSAELLLGHVLGKSRIMLYAEHDKPLEPMQLETYRRLVARAAEHEPIAYLTGTAHFFNLELAVSPAVLIPRPETETLVEHVLQDARSLPPEAQPGVLDVCTGSGCIALAVTRHLKGARTTAVDLSPAALDVAAGNASRLGLTERVTFAEGDLFEAVDAEARFDIITANPPYIPSPQIAGLDRNVRDFEPHLALDGGPDGLAVFRRIVEALPTYLNPGGRFYIEIAFDQADAAAEVVAGTPGLVQPRVIKDLQGHPRVVAGAAEGAAAAPVVPVVPVVPVAPDMPEASEPASDA
ncbi:MAG: peptide chain release factor N(5)-glutamine methyltransferase [Phycisphaerae bacterium]